MDIDHERFVREALPHMGVLHRVAGRLTRNPDEAEDLVQDALLRALRFWARFEPGTDCRAWLLAILRNLFLNRGSRRREIPLSPEALEWMNEVPLWSDAIPSHETASRAHAARSLVARALANTPVGFREVIRLVDLEDRPYQEAARLAGCPVNTLRTRLHRGRRRMRLEITGMTEAG